MSSLTDPLLSHEQELSLVQLLHSDENEAFGDAHLLLEIENIFLSAGQNISEQDMCVTGNSDASLCDEELIGLVPDQITHTVSFSSQEGQWLQSSAAKSEERPVEKDSVQKPVPEKRSRKRKQSSSGSGSSDAECSSSSHMALCQMKKEKQRLATQKCREKQKKEAAADSAHFFDLIREYWNLMEQVTDLAPDFEVRYFAGETGYPPDCEYQNMCQRTHKRPKADSEEERKARVRSVNAAASGRSAKRSKIDRKREKDAIDFYEAENQRIREAIDELENRN